MAGARVERVIGVHAVGDGGKTARARQFVQCGKELVLAEIATIGGFRAVGGIIHFVCFDKFVAQPQFAHKLFHGGAIVSGVTRRECGNGEGAGAQCCVGCPGQIGGVRATRERDNERRNFGEPGEQEFFFFFRGRSSVLCVANMNELSHFSPEYISDSRWHRGLRRHRSHLKSRSTSTVPLPASVCSQWPTFSQCTGNSPNTCSWCVCSFVRSSSNLALSKISPAAIGQAACSFRSAAGEIPVRINLPKRYCGPS